MKRFLLSAVSAWLAFTSPGWSKEPAKLVTQDFHIPSSTAGIELFLRNKHPKDLTTFSSEKTVLYIHGATQPSETVFDLPVGDGSWADYISARGYDVWQVDVRGYGGSTAPKDQSKPFATTREAVEDFGAAVKHVLARRGISKLQLIGWSWGTVIAGTYAAEVPQHVAGLVLLAPPWLSAKGGAAPTDGWQQWTAEASLKRLQAGAPDGQAEKLFPAAWRKTWEAALLANQPAAKASSPPKFRSPTGVVADGAQYWSVNRAFYDPGKIVAPTLLIRGEWDELTPLNETQALFALLRHAPVRKLIEIPRATHFVEVETGRDALFREVQNFLDRH
ncbi:MAG: putative hydrolase [Tardiphaga sp.]|nr:putative hydrolase [Tardiphaga sp.]